MPCEPTWILLRGLLCKQSSPTGAQAAFLLRHRRAGGAGGWAGAASGPAQGGKLPSFPHSAHCGPIHGGTGGAGAATTHCPASRLGSSSCLWLPRLSEPRRATRRAPMHQLIAGPLPAQPPEPSVPTFVQQASLSSRWERSCAHVRSTPHPGRTVSTTVAMMTTDTQLTPCQAWATHLPATTLGSGQEPISLMGKLRHRG